MEELPLLQDGVRRGTICAYADPVRTRFKVRCPALGLGLYKVWLAGGAGRMLLGTLEPSGGGMMLERTCSAGALRAAGVCPPERGELMVCGSGGISDGPEGWRDRKNMPFQPRDAELRRALECSPAGWYCRVSGGWLLAWPWRVGMELPVPSLACLGWPGEVEGRECFLLRFNEKGWPIIHNVAANRKG